MQSFAYLVIAGAAALFQGAAAVPAGSPATITSPASTPTSFPGHYVCKTITTVTSTKPPIGKCLFVCPKLTSTCKPGEPTRSPLPTITTTDLPGCTESVVVQGRCGCATCLPQPTA
ncbi:hypothetical protein F5B20DRAFT_523073 [Whalleya microplaca]|nr:hypothetical protein F5B20DRAFT_523073 [Whalleya microplaca]